MKKSFSIFLLFLLLTKTVFSQYDKGGSLEWDDDEDKWTLARVGFDLAGGAVLAVIGYLVMQFKATNTFGRILVGIGAFLGGGAVVIYLLQVIGMILSAAFSLAYKLAIVVGVILLAVWIIKGVYDWITGNNK